MFREEATSALAAILDNINEKLRPPLPHFNDGKNGAFCVLCQFILDLEFGDVGFSREENWSTLRKTLGAGQEQITNCTQISLHAGIKPRPHWWNPRALTTAVLGLQQQLTTAPFLLS